MISESYRDFNMDNQSKLVCSEFVNRPVSLAACSESVTEFTKSSINPSSTLPHNWGQNLFFLLEDTQGVSLFQKFLKRGEDTRCLSFWFACQGIKKCDHEDKDSLIKLINIVFKKQVKRISTISIETKEEIRLKLSSGTNIDGSIFDVAQREVETYMMKTSYPSFLKSDIYFKFLTELPIKVSTEKECIVPSKTINHLPMIYEDSELQIGNIPGTKNKLLKTFKRKISDLLKRSKSSVSKVKPEGSVGQSKSPINRYSSYSKAGSNLLTSVQDSESQSLSSDAVTYSTISFAYNGVDIPGKHTNSLGSFEPSFIINDEDSLGTNIHEDYKSCISQTQYMPHASPSVERLKLLGKENYSYFLNKLNKVAEKQEVREEKMEKLKKLENIVNRKSEAISTSDPSKSNKTHIFEYGFLYGPSEENAHDILDNHVAKVFGSESPPATARPCIDALEMSSMPMQSVSSCEQSQDVFRGASHKHNLFQFTVPNSMKDGRSTVYHKPEAASTGNPKSNVTHIFKYGFLDGPPEENAQAILDRHISEVFDSGSTSPTDQLCSDVLESPSMPIQSVSSWEQVPDASLGVSHSHAQCTVRNSMKHRRSAVCPNSETTSTRNPLESNMNYVFKHGLLSNLSEENSHDILDRHVSRMVDPESPPVTDRPCSDVLNRPAMLMRSVSSCEQPVDVSLGTLHKNSRFHFTVPNSMKQRRDTQSADSALSDDDISSDYRNLNASDSEHYSLCSRQHSEHNMNKFSSISDVSTCIDSGVGTSLASERVGSYRSKKLSLKSGPTTVEEAPVGTESNDVTLICYRYGRHPAPYLSKFSGKDITLGQFKSLLARKGNFRYFFKTAKKGSNTRSVLEEVTDECKVIPLWKEKVSCVIRPMEDINKKIKPCVT